MSSVGSGDPIRTRSRSRVGAWRLEELSQYRESFGRERRERITGSCIWGRGLGTGSDFGEIREEG